MLVSRRVPTGKFFSDSALSVLGCNHLEFLFSLQLAHLCHILRRRCGVLSLLYYAAKEDRVVLSLCWYNVSYVFGICPLYCLKQWGEMIYLLESDSDFKIIIIWGEMSYLGLGVSMEDELTIA